MTTTANTSTFNNYADGPQVGVNQGVIHTSIYHYSVGDPPERKFEVALTYLRGGQPREAEKILEELRHQPDLTTRFHYHYVLSILSERTLNELPPREFNRIFTSLRAAAALPQDVGSYKDALKVIELLLSYIERQDRQSTPSADELADAFQEFSALPQDRQDEIARHMDMILDGAIQDVLDDSVASIASSRRMDNRRAQRAWLFFQPHPAAPQLAGLEKMPFDFPKWAMLVVGGLAVLLGLPAVIGDIIGPLEAPAGAPWFSLLMVVGGGFLLIWFRVLAKLMDVLREVKEAEYSALHRTAPGTVPQWKIDEIQSYVEGRFAKERPPRRDTRYDHNGQQAGEKDWDRDTAGLVLTTIDWFVRVYGGIREIRPPALIWLIGWHVSRIKERWEAGTLTDFRRELKTPWYAKVLVPVGAILAVLGTLALVGMGATSSALTLGIGIGLGAAGIEVVTRLRARAQWRREFAELLREEQQAYEGWLELLRDRPSDDEMAYWLDFDLMHLKSRAMRSAQLSSKDMICHVELTEGTAYALRARDQRAPVRYSDYYVKIFLLTDGGVHETEYELDFKTGTVRDPHHMSFRYDALASARLAEVSVQWAHGRRIRKLADGTHQVADQMIFQQALWLSLVNAEEISVLIDDFRGLTDSGDDQSKLREMALQSSGVQSALHILQAVAREGREWITRQRARRKRWWEDYYEKKALELDGGRQQRRELR